MRYLFVSLLLVCLGANARTSDCAPLLSSNTLPEESPFQTAYLNLLNLTLEGLDEIENPAFGHADRVQVKAQLLTSIAASQKPIDPLDVLLNLSTNESEISRNNSVHPAIEGHTLHSRAQPPPRNLTQFSPKLSTLADSGQFQAVIENLTPADWPHICKAAQQKLSDFQTIQTAQVVATPATEHDYEDMPDSNGNTRLHRLILARKFVDALRLIERPHFSQHYISILNEKDETAIDLLFEWLGQHDTNKDHIARQLYRTLQAKGAVLNLSKYREKIFVYVREENTAALRKIHSLGVDLSSLRTYAFSYLHHAIEIKSLKTIKLLVKLKAQHFDYSTPHGDITPLVYAILENNPLEVIETLLLGKPDLEFKHLEPRLLHQTAFLFAAADCREDIMKLLIEQGANIYVQNVNGSNFLHLISSCKNSSQIMDLFRDISFEAIINQTNQDIHYYPYPEQTPLHLAVKNKNVALVRRLIELNADPSILDHNKKSAVDLAGGDKAILVELEKYKLQRKRKP